MTFQELGINKNILKAIARLGFVKSTPIQEQSIPVLIKGNTDYIGLAQTGTGKTAAFGLPLIDTIDVTKNHTQALILCPTRELCLQITKELQSYAVYVDGLKIVPVYGGVDIIKQIRSLKRGAHIIVGTPGRLLDHIRRNTLSLKTVQVVVLDEADEMLNMGFQEDINSILKQTPKEKNIWLFSATMPKRVERIADDYMVDPFKVTIGSKNSTAQNIEHQYCMVTRPNRYEALKRFIDDFPGLFGILFCRTRRDTKDIAQKLIKDGYNADALHGDLSQSQRDVVMKKFRNKNLQLLVATDVAARGIDVNDITHVIHYTLPEDIENYTHRSGRTARAGKSGISIAIVSPREAGNIKYIEREIGKKITYVSVPSGSAITKKQLAHFIKTIDTVAVDEKSIGQYLDAFMEKFDELSKKEVIARFLSIEFNSFLQRYNRAQNLNADLTTVKHSSGNQSFQRVFINLGAKDGLNKGSLLRFICDTSLVQSKYIGKIVLQDAVAFVDIEGSETANTVINSLKEGSFNGRKIRIEFSLSKQRSTNTGQRRYNVGQRSNSGQRSNFGRSRTRSRR